MPSTNAPAAVAGLTAALLAATLAGPPDAAAQSASARAVRPRPQPLGTSTPAPRSDRRSYHGNDEAAAPVILNSKTFHIPFRIDAVGTNPVQVHLYVSRDGDGQWELLDRQPPTVQRFQFNGAEDGTFWFATRTVDASGNAHPSGPIRPQLKVLVDTTEPTIRLDAEADEEGNVRGHVAVDDATPLRSVQVQYLTDAERQWKTLDGSQLGSDGSLSFYPGDAWQQLSLHVRASDAAGNQSAASQRVHRPRVARGPGGQLARDRRRAGQGSVRPASAPIGFLAPGGGAPRPATTGSGQRRGVPTQQQVGRQPPSVDRASTGSAAQAYQSLPAGGLPATFRGGGMLMADPSSGQPKARPRSRESSEAPEGQAPEGQSLPQAPEGQSLPREAPEAPEGQGQEGQSLPRESLQGERAFHAEAPGGQAPGGQSLPRSLPRGQSRHPADSRSSANLRADETLPPPRRLGGQGPTESSGGSQGLSLSGPAQLNGPAQRSGPAQHNRSSESAQPASPDRLAPSSPSGEPQRSRPRTPSEAMHPIAEDLVPVTQQADNGDSASLEPRPAADVDAGGEDSIDRIPNRQSIPLPRSARPRSQARRVETPPTSDSPTGGGLSRIDLDQLERRAPVRFSDSPRFSLEYELEAVGSRGVETVELWGSLDAGETWKRWGTDPDRTSPFDIETAGEGVFGFRSVVLGANGLISPSPLAGDMPDIVVVVDTTDPQVRLTGARYGEGDQVGSLVITYECTDAHLLQRPITLSFSDQPDGPWTTIAAGLRNRGEYVWPADPELPREIFLRIDATDRAGNVGTYILDQPIRTQGLAPRAKIRGFRATRAAATAAAPADDSGRGDPTAGRKVDGRTVR